MTEDPDLRKLYHDLASKCASLQPMAVPCQGLWPTNGQKRGPDTAQQPA